MTCDASSELFDDPAHRWTDLFDGLHGRRRDAVVESLRASTKRGHPASSDGVRHLVAYALGQISARQYATRMLDSLGFAAAAPPSRTKYGDEPLPELATWHPAERRPGTWQEPQRMQSAPRSTSPSRDHSREATVQAYLSGRIPVEEFLRLSRVRVS